MPSYRLALGTVQFGMPYGIANKSGQVSRNEAGAILGLASENNIDTIDTAIAYGGSEECLGFAGVQKFNVITKLPQIPDNVSDIAQWIFQNIDASLSRLNVNSLYGVLLHRSNQFLEESVKEALFVLRKSGKVKKVGISIYSPSELEAIPFLETLDIVQAPFNLVDQRLVKSGWLKFLNEKGIEVHTRSAFLQGLLLMPRNSIPKGFSPWNALFDLWHKWLVEKNISAVHACLSFVLSFQEVDRVVVGVETAKQLMQLIDVSRMTFDFDFPDIASDEEKLINPSYWSSL